MGRDLTIDEHTKLSQGRASTPTNSAWVSANAGSGKTYVLAQRVVRQLLSGVDPSRILCLTYTKAAAGEMSNRVFDILGQWVGLNDAELSDEIERIEGMPASPAQLARARILFARALETPGGLKIQTIHAFCEALLHQFPLEANVPGTFTVMDDQMQRQLMAQARQSIALTAHARPDSSIGSAFLDLMDLASDAQINKVFGEIVNQREPLASWLERIGGPEAATGHARQLLEFEPSDSVESLTDAALGTSLFQQLDCREIAVFAESTGATNSLKLAAQLRAFLTAQSPQEAAIAVDDILLTKTGTLRSFGKYPSKDIENRFPGLRSQMEADGEQWLAAKSRIKTLQLILKTQPLLVVAEAMISYYAQEKRQRGLLDFDDLIDRTADLLSRSDARAWVLYKLDLGIDHVLLDEAQDTSPKQWQIISALADEFFTGQSARLAQRTVFAVGDEKQSIYSFRGAEPRNFAEQKRRYQRQADATQKTFEDVALGLSFRSTMDVLAAVDAVFDIEEHAKGVTFDATPPAHTAARQKDAGSVEVWDLIEAAPGDDPENWHVPIDIAGQHQALLLADKMAGQIASWVGTESIEATGKKITAGDILVLVRSRDRFVGALNRGLKARGIAVSGADRLIITDHIAIKDLIALGQITLTPQDDLALAAVLKSPLIGLSEDDLFNLAQNRFLSTTELTLFEALKHAEGQQFCDAFDQITQWQKLSDQVPVYEFYARILGTMGGRKKILARLGNEAEDVMDAFLDTALAYEQGSLPGLQAFLEALQEDQPEIKREMDASAGEVRIMTVHAAKGLEAPIVFLVDKGSQAFQSQHAPSLYGWSEQDQEACYLWVPKSDQHCSKTLDLRDDERRRAEEEYRRLLYVGMTRAEDRLIICGYRGKTSPGTPNWHDMVRTALEPDWQDVYASGDGGDGGDDGGDGGDGGDEPGEEVLWHRWKAPGSPATIVKPENPDASSVPIKSAKLPDWISKVLPPEIKLPRPLNPSGAQAVIDESLAQQPALASPFQQKSMDPNAPDPRRRGTALHKLLQVLPDLEESSRWSEAEAYLAAQLPQYTPELRHDMLQSLRNVLDHPQLTDCFDPQTSRGEVSLMGTIATKYGPRSVSGQIDRLSVGSEEVVILDYKTNLQVPGPDDQIPPDYVTQLALYRELVARLYPKMPIKCMLVWTHGTEGPLITELENARLDAAYLQIAQL
ncbi:MAG: double-strand break repair helicase AddA [Rhizobiaceae bacterium]|nr:double-strand break repair helicase AddA [Rhizobiaceae bacterium]